MAEVSSAPTAEEIAEVPAEPQSRADVAAESISMFETQSVDVTAATEVATHASDEFAQLQEKTAQFQQELESLRTVNANLKFMNAKLVAENKEVTDMVATDMIDMVRAECERLSSQQAESLTALQNDHIEIQNDHIKRLSQKADTNEKECTKLATENRAIQRKYQSLKDMYLDLCAKS